MFGLFRAYTPSSSAAGSGFFFNLRGWGLPSMLGESILPIGEEEIVLCECQVRADLVVNLLQGWERMEMPSKDRSRSWRPSARSSSVSLKGRRRRGACLVNGEVVWTLFFGIPPPEGWQRVGGGEGECLPSVCMLSCA